MGGTDEVAQNSDIGAISTDAARIHRKAELFRLLQVNARIIKFGQTKTLRGQNSIEAGGIHRTRRAMTTPRPTSYLVELLPIAFLPSGHAVFLFPDFLNFARAQVPIRPTNYPLGPLPGDCNFLQLPPFSKYVRPWALDASGPEKVHPCGMPDRVR